MDEQRRVQQSNISCQEGDTSTADARNETSGQEGAISGQEGDTSTADARNETSGQEGVMSCQEGAMSCQEGATLQQEDVGIQILQKKVQTSTKGDDKASFNETKNTATVNAKYR